MKFTREFNFVDFGLFEFRWNKFKRLEIETTLYLFDLSSSCGTLCAPGELPSKGLFNGGRVPRPATRLEGLTHDPPLHATHLTGTVSRLLELSFERPLSTTNKMVDQRNFFSF